MLDVCSRDFAMTLRRNAAVAEMAFQRHALDAAVHAYRLDCSAPRTRRAAPAKSTLCRVVEDPAKPSRGPHARARETQLVAALALRNLSDTSLATYESQCHSGSQE